MSRKSGESTRNFGWVVVAAITLAFTVTSGARLLPGVILKTVTEQNHWSRSDFLLAITINMVVLSICQPFIGWAADRFGGKSILIGGIALLGVSVIPISYATQLWQFYVYYGVVGAFALAMISPVNITAMVTGWFEEERRGAALSIATSGSAFGQLMIVPAATWLLTATTWPQLYRGLSVILLVVVVPLSIVLIRSNPAAAKMKAKTARTDRPSMGLRQALNTSSFWLLSFGFFTCGFTMAFANAHFLAYASDMGMTATAAADVVAATALFSIGGSFALGMAADRWPRHRVLALTYALRGLSFVLLWILPVGNLLYVYAIVLGISWTATTPLTAAISAELYGPAQIGVIFGAMYSFMNLGFGAGSFLDGVVYDSFGNYRAALLVNAIMGGLAAFAVLRSAKRTRPGEPAAVWTPAAAGSLAGD